MVDLFEDKKESIQVVAASALSVNVMTECKGKKSGVLSSCVILSFAVVVPYCTFS